MASQIFQVRLGLGPTIMFSPLFRFVLALYSASKSMYTAQYGTKRGGM